MNPGGRYSNFSSPRFAIVAQSAAGIPLDVFVPCLAGQPIVGRPVLHPFTPFLAYGYPLRPRRYGVGLNAKDTAHVFVGAHPFGGV